MRPRNPRPRTKSKNCANQTEQFNNDKDQMLGIVVTPNAQLSWTLNYYRGQEHPDVVYLQTAPAGQPNLPLHHRGQKPGVW